MEELAANLGVELSCVCHDLRADGMTWGSEYKQMVSLLCECVDGSLVHQLDKIFFRTHHSLQSKIRIQFEYNFFQMFITHHIFFRLDESIGAGRTRIQSKIVFRKLCSGRVFLQYGIFECDRSNLDEW